LNGRYYRTLPEKIKAGIDRRSITSIVLLKESTATEEEASMLRETVFDRLNTGGIKLERQEIRNALLRGPFNDLLDEISRWDLFRTIWQMPLYVKGEIETNEELRENTLYSKMGDNELVLRFFALRHAAHYKGGMQPFLDLYMRKASKFDKDDLDILRLLYQDTMKLAHGIYGDLTFRLFNIKENAWEEKPHKAFYDAVMVALSRNLTHASSFLESSDEIVQKTRELFEATPEGTFTGRANTKADIEGRIGLFEKMLSNFVEQ
jgi:hypothetical protein